ncbi:uncharacterized protein MELLADRAFT_67485 [Melampsora larici-populina 98AG31]|uniref:Cleavage and polyadenylation specificity factor 2 C-terminal domain-containing protein n=1 Tax=Melampsora larici-populina (strain 98AG31 / pathotype 3-4-7) TaxID=747676 RepID=F4S3A9_MELLP|nr:uncharacterized protein MELLADRAFT_67485 [Melampsora larici-populina 98AG31]EGG00785.1 hypothetical protein MELLADRAFT_67485 [Melampsora larici-populina 98AG31]
MFERNQSGEEKGEKGFGESLHKFISETAEVKVVLINGPGETHQEFIGNVSAIPTFITKIFLPKIGECSVIGHDTKSFKVKGFEVGYLTGNLQVLDGSSIPTLEKSPNGLNNSTQLTQHNQRTSKPKDTKDEGFNLDVTHQLDALPITSSTIYIGEIKLIVSKSFINSIRIQAEFTGGVLICGPMSQTKPNNLYNPIKKEVPNLNMKL